MVPVPPENARVTLLGSVDRESRKADAPGWCGLAVAKRQQDRSDESNPIPSFLGTWHYTICCSFYISDRL